jgi:hypothetical protein
VPVSTVRFVRSMCWGPNDSKPMGSVILKIIATPWSESLQSEAERLLSVHDKMMRSSRPSCGTG